MKPFALPRYSHVPTKKHGVNNDEPYIPEEPIQLPLNGILDLHTFHPREVSAVVEAFIEASAEAGLHDLRIIHGKGIGTLREQVHRLLQSDARVKSYQLASIDAGGWGATLVRLRKELQ